MPLIQGKSKAAFGSNVGKEMDSGKPQKQALAIAYNVMKKNRKKMAAGGAVENEDLDPEHEAGMESKPTEGIMVEDVPEKMAVGGIAVHPMHMAHLIMAKKMAAGGEAYPVEKDQYYPDGGPVLDDDKVDQFTKGFKSAFAEGGEVDDGEYDNSDSESASLPFDDEDAVGVPALGYDSAREDAEGMHERADVPTDKKKMLDKIMRGLQKSHYGM